MSDIAWDTTRKILQENYEEHAPSNCDSHEGLVAWRAMVAVYRANRLAAENARLTARLAKMEAALEDFVRTGTRTDLQPTCGHMRDSSWWADYHARADRHVRERARMALRAEPPQDGAREAVSE